MCSARCEQLCPVNRYVCLQGSQHFMETKFSDFSLMKFHDGARGIFTTAPKRETVKRDVHTQKPLYQIIIIQ